jgi:hypothetical protein
MISQLLSSRSITIKNAANTIGIRQKNSNTVLFNLVSLTLKNLPHERKRTAKLNKLIAGIKNRVYAFSSGIVSLQWSHTSECI